MIYDEKDQAVTIIANAGIVRPKGFHANMTLVEVKYRNGRKSKIPAEFLHADDGFMEIREQLERINEES